MAFWKQGFLDGIRNEWLRRLDKIQYYSGGAWHDAVITSKKVNGNTIELLSETTDSSASSITSVRIIDVYGNVAGQADENILRKSTQSVLTLWKFPLYENEN